jgi:hypothetical protein
MIDTHPEKIQEKTKKYENLTNDIKARGWNIDPILVSTTNIHCIIYQKFITKIKRIYNIPKQQTKTLAKQININAIRYSMYMLLCKRKLENNQSVPTTPHFLNN